MEVKTPRVIEIPKGSTSYIISYLDKKNYDVNLIDQIILNLIGYPQSGWIDLKSTQMTKMEFLYKLTTSKAALKKITLIPGETYYFFLQQLAQELNISTIKLFDKYAVYAFKKDGNILAETYHLPIGMNEEQLIKHLFNTTEKKYSKYSTKIFGLYDKENWYKYITIASIIQKEAANKKEMPIISSIIYNRLAKKMKLQMDGTLNYSKYSHTKITPKMIKEDKSEYNTYKNKGLPDNPVCAVEFEAIKAAIFPAKTDYLYFVKSPNDNTHLFSSSYKKHKKHIKAIKKITRNSKTTQKTTTDKVKKKQIEPSRKNIKNLKDLWK